MIALFIQEGNLYKRGKQKKSASDNWYFDQICILKEKFYAALTMSLPSMGYISPEMNCSSLSTLMDVDIRRVSLAKQQPSSTVK